MTELPPSNTRRWVARRKAAVVAAVSSGMITIEEACRRYHMSEEEFSTWRRAFEALAFTAYALVAFSSSAAFVSPERPTRHPAKSSAVSRSDKARDSHQYYGKFLKTCCTSALSTLAIAGQGV